MSPNATFPGIGDLCVNACAVSCPLNCVHVCVYMLQLALVGLFLAVITTGMLTSFALIQTYIYCAWWWSMVVACGRYVMWWWYIAIGVTGLQTIGRLLSADWH